MFQCKPGVHQHLSSFSTKLNHYTAYFACIIYFEMNYNVEIDWLIRHCFYRTCMSGAKACSSIYVFVTPSQHILFVLLIFCQKRPSVLITRFVVVVVVLLLLLLPSSSSSSHYHYYYYYYYYYYYHYYYHH